MTEREAMGASPSPFVEPSAEEVERWQSRLDASLRSHTETVGAPTRWVRSVVVVPSIGSTQDLARDRGLVAGEVITALRQTAGRGRFGRGWDDTIDAGTATSFVIPALPAEVLLLRSAVAVAIAIELLRPGALRVGIKWPNDLIAPDGGKLGGILIECVGQVAIVGVGINVLQRTFPPDIAPRARSLGMLGVAVERVEVVERLIISFEQWLDADLNLVRAAYLERDVLRGTMARFRVGDRVVIGRVIEVDPAHGIRIAREGGEEVLPAALTTLAVDPGG
ncbi:MAG: biotin--[acetyl-CoA-carboxylase] ligase [Phycisphaeraceae bacterium]|nr:biotin--[acetyl-CoA-carboxylase] ligase [Phycisphaeraceae bacterium]